MPMSHIVVVDVHDCTNIESARPAAIPGTRIKFSYCLVALQNIIYPALVVGKLRLFYLKL